MSPGRPGLFNPDDSEGIVTVRLVTLESMPFFSRLMQQQCCVFKPFHCDNENNTPGCNLFISLHQQFSLFPSLSSFSFSFFV